MKVGNELSVRALFPDSFSWMNYSGAIALWSGEYDQIGESARGREEGRNMQAESERKVWSIQKQTVRSRHIVHNGF